MESPDGQTLKGPGDEDDDQIVSTLGEIGEAGGNYIHAVHALHIEYLQEYIRNKHFEILGPWQWKIILITGIFTIPISSHVLVMTFMNAEVNSVTVS